MMGPSGGNQDIAGLFSLLEIVSDPAKSKKKLEELASASIEASKMLETAREEIKKNTALLDSIWNKEKEVQRQEEQVQEERLLLKEKKEVLAKEMNDFVSVRAVFSARKDETTKVLEAKAKELKEKEEVLLVSLSQKEEELKEKLKVVSAQISDYTNKLSALRSLVK